MSSTCQEIANLALTKLGVVAAGGTPEAADLTLAIASLKSYYQKLINSGTFGRLTDIIPSISPYEAGENERVVHDGSVSVELPLEVPLSYISNDYGLVSYSTDIGSVRPPRDLTMVEVVRTDTGTVENHIYDNRLRKWCEITNLEADSIAPLSHRDEDGLASAVAMRLAASFKLELTRETLASVMHFEEALANNWSQAGEFQVRGEYW